MTKNEDLKAAVHAATFSMEAATLCGQDYCTVMHRDLERIIEATRHAAVPTDGDAERALILFDRIVILFVPLEKWEKEVNTIRTALQSTRPAVTPTDTAMEDAALLKRSREVFAKGEFLGHEKSAEFISGILADGDAERALEALDEVIAFGCHEGCYEHVSDFVFGNEEILRTALQSTRKPPVPCDVKNGMLKAALISAYDRLCQCQNDVVTEAIADNVRDELIKIKATMKIIGDEI